MKCKLIILNIYLGIIMIFCNCQSQVTNYDDVIPILPTEANSTLFLSAIVDSVEYIRLETNEHSAMAEIREIVIKDKYIYVREIDRKTIFIFDKMGKYVTKLDKRGDGPDQYATLDQFLVDDDETYIEILDYRGQKSRILRYTNISFNLLEEFRFPVPTANSWRKEKGKNIYYFACQQFENEVGNEITNADIIAVKDYSSQKKLFEKNIITNGYNYGATIESLTTNEKGEVFASLMFSNTFYKLSDMKAVPIMTIDFGKFSMDNSYRLKSTEEQLDYWVNKTEGMASFPVLNINSSNLFAFTYYFKSQGKNQLHQYLQFKNLNKVFHVKDVVNDLTSYPSKIYLSSYYFGVKHEVLHGDYLVDIVLPWHTNEGRIIDVPGVGSVEPEDNPVIVMMKLKKEYLK